VDRLFGRVILYSKQDLSILFTQKSLRRLTYAHQFLIRFLDKTLDQKRQLADESFEKAHHSLAGFVDENKWKLTDQEKYQKRLEYMAWFKPAWHELTDDEQFF
jgi:hypothetical protein